MLRAKEPSDWLSGGSFAVWILEDIILLLSKIFSDGVICPMTAGMERCKIVFTAEERLLFC